MKKFLVSAAVLGLALGLAAAQAAPNDHNNRTAAENSRKGATNPGNSMQRAPGGAIKPPQHQAPATKGPQSGRPSMMGGPQGKGRVDVTRFRGNVHAQKRFRSGTYRAPRSYKYRRWTYGERLPAIYFARDYWLPNFVTFGLMAPPYGYGWVRFGPDALLVDLRTGEVIRVVYGIFY
ncbi:MAG TPA: RcnB family protein [Rhizomicrobium sp.]